MRAVLIPLFCAVGILAAPPPVHGDELPGDTTAAPPRLRLCLSSLTVGRYNPLGLSVQHRLMYSLRLFDSSSPLFRDTFIALGPSLKINPTNLKAGPLLEFQPLALVHLRLGYEFVRFFGTSGHLQSFPFREVPYSDSYHDHHRNLGYAASGHRYFIEPALQMKAGPVAARTIFTLEWWSVDLRRGDRFFYDPTLDSILPTGELVWANDTDLLYIDGRLILGVRWSSVFPGSRRYHMRVGPVVAWSFNTDDYSLLNRPTVLLVLGWYLRHPSRGGWAPYGVIGFTFSTDFL
ncbi:MAG: hypothetical protein JXA20_05380 [Spirochaetes bacterium]|nr:hypothetical protein [Spirochaetota bacterium]